jgi:hypothetical protein
MAAPLPAGSYFVVLNSTVVQNVMSRSDINVSFWWKDGPSSRSIAESSYNTREYAFRGEGLRAYSPTNLTLEQVGTNLLIKWARRTRIGGDNWSLDEVPLSEEYEKYVVEIRKLGNIVRTYTVFEQQVTYPSADYAVDFGTMPTDLEISVTQLTPYGRGSERREWVHLWKVTA